jgi:hypothetical protein
MQRAHVPSVRQQKLRHCAAYSAGGAENKGGSIGRHAMSPFGEFE